MKNKLTLIAFTFFSISFAQNVNIATKDGETIYSSQNYVVEKNNVNDAFYIDKEYKPATVKNYIGTRNYRYNANTDDLEYVDGKKLFNLEKQDGLQVDFINGVTYRFLTYINKDGKFEKGFLQTLTDKNSKNVLYKFVRITKSEKNNTNSYNNMETVKFRTTIDYYIGDETSAKFVSNKNKEFNDITKANGLNLKKEQDLIKLVDILNK
ncbi:MAG TPA: hypothetical protein DEQ26_07220 [Flavobacteriaceae bacterium]|nr:hypothetical protein [Flavobacteriaceae bacterium]